MRQALNFDSSKTSFGRHETFSLRYSWLTKGFRALKNDKSIFNKDDATVVLGVGKNMVNSIRYWLIACQIVDENLVPTDVGAMLFDAPHGEDEYLEDEATVWLIHWLLVSNPDKATIFYWFFNKFNKPDFNIDEVLGALDEFIQEEMHDVKKPSASTVRNDVSLILRAYSKSSIDKKGVLEEHIDSPLSTLGLIAKKRGEGRYSSMAKRYNTLPEEILAYALISILRSSNRKSISMNDLLYSTDKCVAPGTVFRLTETGLINKLESLAAHYPNLIEIRDVAGVNQVFLIDENKKPEEMYKGYVIRMGVSLK